MKIRIGPGFEKGEGFLVIPSYVLIELGWKIGDDVDLDVPMVGEAALTIHKHLIDQVPLFDRGE